ncbi:hypothetical protein GCM10020295_36510 [Streptomyces cinereospinus]
MGDVTDLPEPQPTVDDLSNLIPAVIPDDEADAELVTIGERYWALAGLRSGLRHTRVVREDNGHRDRWVG